MKIKVGLIGFGRMGRFYLKEMQKSGRWDVAYICDINPDCRELAKQLSPESKILENEQEMFDDESVQVVRLSHWQTQGLTGLKRLSNTGNISSPRNRYQTP